VSITTVVTRQDRPKGRGQKVTETPVKARAIAAAVRRDGARDAAERVAAAAS
jgi:methionyl-tRNA formyltransferase